MPFVCKFNKKLTITHSGAEYLDSDNCLINKTGGGR